MRRIQFPQGGGDKPIGGNNVNNQNFKLPKNNDLANALSGKSAPKFADATDAMEQLLNDPANESLRKEVISYLAQSAHQDDTSAEDMSASQAFGFQINTKDTAEATAKATAQASEMAIVEGVEVKDPSDAMDKMLKGEISREGAMAYIKSTIPEGDILYDD